MALKAGERRHLIAFERPEISRDPLGGEGSTQWHLVIKVWAKRTNQLGATAEAVAAGADRYREQVRFDLLARPVDPSWRIVAGGKVFDIKSIGPSNDGSETAVIAVSGISDG